MRVLIFTVAVLASSFVTYAHLLSANEIEEVFKKYANNELSDSEIQQFQDLLEIFHRPARVSTKSLDDTSPVRSTLDCLLCRSVFATVFEGVQNGQSDKQITDIVADLCLILGIENYNVCYGAVALNMPIITYIIKNTPAASPRSFCGLILQNDANPNYCHLHDVRFEWEVDLPSPAASATVPVFDVKPLKIALISDAHIDPLYEAFGVAECGEPTCCRKGQTLSDAYLYKSNIDEFTIAQSIINASSQVMLDLSVASKIRLEKSLSRNQFPPQRKPETAGYWGDYRNCDTPLWAFDNVIDTISEAHKDIDLVYYIGDTIDHGVWGTSHDLIKDMNRYIVDKIRKSFGDDVLVVPTLGNHESQPTNQFAPPSITEDYLNTTWLYKTIVDKWGFYLTDKAKSTLLDRGHFSLVVRPGLRVISVNNNVAYIQNWWLQFDPIEAKRHLDWLVDELYEAEAAGEKVHIIAHIPPGVSSLTKTWTREYNRIVNRFTSTIAAEFNGHTHSDEFKIFYNSEGKPINMAWGAGSTTSYAFYNLNYKILDINTKTYEPENIVNYVYNLTEANLTPNRKPHWFQLYDMKNTFTLSDLSAASMDDLVHSMVTTNKELLDIYNAFFEKLSDSRWPECNQHCKLNHLCKTVVTELWKREKCNELQRLYFLSKNH